MAKNKEAGDNKRAGAVKERSQVHNPKTDTWTKRNAETGKFMDQRADKKPFRGIRTERDDVCFEGVRIVKPAVTSGRFVRKEK